jgi:hypothetical protein
VFEQYFLDERPMLSANYATRLLLGDGYKQRGILQHLRDLGPFSMSGMNMMNFLGTLLDSRRNHQIDLFRQIYVKYDIRHLSEL